MFYRELHCDSSLDGQSGTDKNHPRYDLSGPMYIDKFSVKSVSLPVTFQDFPLEQTIAFRFTNAGVTFLTSPNPNGTLSVGSYDSAEFLTFLNTALADFVLNAVGDDGDPGPPIVPPTNVSDLIQEIIASYNELGHVVYTIQYSPLGQFDGLTQTFSVVFPSSKTSRRTYQLQQRMGYGATLDDADLDGFFPIDVLAPVVAGPGGSARTGDRPVDLVPTRYIMLRSSLGSGSAFTPNIRGKENIQKGGNIIAKISTDVGNIGFGERYLYTNGDNLSPDTMFTYNGGYINNFDLYFTRPHDDTPIDFDGYSFDVTLAVSASFLQ